LALSLVWATFNLKHLVALLSVSKLLHCGGLMEPASNVRASLSPHFFQLRKSRKFVFWGGIATMGTVNITGGDARSLRFITLAQLFVNLPHSVAEKLRTKLHVLDWPTLLIKKILVIISRQTFRLDQRRLFHNEMTFYLICSRKFQRNVRPMCRNFVLHCQGGTLLYLSLGYRTRG